MERPAYFIMLCYIIVFKVVFVELALLFRFTNFNMDVSERRSHWIELNWIELNWIELNWIELNWVELNWIELNWIELNSDGFNSVRHERTDTEMRVDIW